MPKPNFFIVGAAKCGTTSLYHYLEQHPEIGMASYKEPCYLCHNQMYKTQDKYLSLFDHISSNAKAVGEASVNYISAPESPKLIKEFNPVAKIVIILRNPVDRAFSLYKWMVRGGFENSPTFERSLKLEKQRQKQIFLSKRPIKYNYNYFSSGLYYEQIKRYYDIFDHNKIMIISFDELKSDLSLVLNKIYQFLDVSIISIDNKKIYNKSKYPLSAKAQYFFRNNLYNSLSLSKDKKGKMYGNIFVDILAGINSNLGKEPILSLETAKILQKKYEVDLKNLEKIIPFSTKRWQSKY